MLLTKEQISEQMCKHAQKRNGLHDLMEIMLESMMIAEHSEFLIDNPGNKGNGYRPGSTYDHGRKLEFRIPRDRYGNLHPQFSLSCATRRRNVTVWQEYSTPKA